MRNLLTHTLFASGSQLGVTLLVVFLAQVVYALFGFGSGILALALLAFFFPEVSDVVVLLLLVNLPTEIFVVWRDRAQLPLRDIVPLLAGLAAGIPAGALLLLAGTGGRWPVHLLAGTLVVFAAFFLLERGGTGARRLPPGTSTAAGLTSGVLAGLFGTGGPPVILYFRTKRLPKSAFRAALLAVFLLTSFVRVPVYFATGIAAADSAYSALAVLPASLAGLALGHRLHLDVSERSFQRAAAVLIGILGVLLFLVR